MIVLVHGFGCNAAVWYPLRRWLDRFGGVDHRALDLEPVLVDLDRMVEQVRAFVQSVCAEHPERPLVIVGHSMGGIVARRCLQTMTPPASLRALVTLGSPHAGTTLARFHPAPNAVQMRPGSDWLRRLAAGTDPVRLVCVASHHDQVVVPQSSALVAGARAHWLSGVGHLAMLLDRRVRELLARELERASTAAASGRLGP